MRLIEKYREMRGMVVKREGFLGRYIKPDESTLDLEESGEQEVYSGVQLVGIGREYHHNPVGLENARHLRYQCGVVRYMFDDIAQYHSAKGAIAERHAFPDIHAIVNWERSGRILVPREVRSAYRIPGLLQRAQDLSIAATEFKNRVPRCDRVPNEVVAFSLSSIHLSFTAACRIRCGSGAAT